MARTGTDAPTDDEVAAVSIDPEVPPVGPEDDGEDEGDNPERP